METLCLRWRINGRLMMGAKLVCGVSLLLCLFASAAAHQCSHEDHHHHHHDDLKLESQRQTSKLQSHDADDDHVHGHHSPAHSVGSKTGHANGDVGAFRLPEEIHEERELEEYGFDGHHHDHEHAHDHDHDRDSLSVGGLWLQAMGSSLLVSSASLVCLTILPLIVSQGKPSRGVVDALASFGAGTMLGDAFLHQLPHAFGGSGHSHSEHSHNHEHGHQHGHDEIKSSGHSHGHSIEDLSVGLAVLGGILLFFLVEKIVRRAEELSVGNTFGHSHNHHKPRKEVPASQKVKESQTETIEGNGSNSKKGMRKRTGKVENNGELPVEKSKITDVQVSKKSTNKTDDLVEAECVNDATNLVFGYLNLFSDAVHNFTDGMALGSAFLLHGTVGGWSRTLFLLAHELPQEVGDFGILVRSGFGVFKALAFNFLSALVALAGTALALMMGGSTGNSSIIEGFTAGGFIYIAVGSVMPDMHSQGSSLKTSLSQLCALTVGMGIAVAISLAE
ncbi:solute carrier family 39 (zinc transporter), member 7 [Marchantia polymorpha subsp. ruderalis]